MKKSSMHVSERQQKIKIILNHECIDPVFEPKIAVYSAAAP
jgi:hypothetical protein